MCPVCRSRSFFQNEPWKKSCLTCYLKNKTGTVKVALATPAIEPSMVKRLLFLAHPDKHNGSEASQIATKYLLSLKKLLNT
jgi:hypothetical protein